MSEGGEARNHEAEIEAVGRAIGAAMARSPTILSGLEKAAEAAIAALDAVRRSPQRVCSECGDSDRCEHWPGRTLVGRSPQGKSCPIADYAAALEAALQRILDHGNTHEEPCWALHNGDCADVFQEIARATLRVSQDHDPGRDD